MKKVVTVAEKRSKQSVATASIFNIQAAQILKRATSIYNISKNRDTYSLA